MGTGFVSLPPPKMKCSEHTREEGDGTKFFLLTLANHNLRWFSSAGTHSESLSWKWFLEINRILSLQRLLRLDTANLVIRGQFLKENNNVHCFHSALKRNTEVDCNLPILPLLERVQVKNRVAS